MQYNISRVANHLDQYCIYADPDDQNEKSVYLGMLNGKENAELFVKALEEKDKEQEPIRIILGMSGGLIQWGYHDSAEQGIDLAIVDWDVENDSDCPEIEEVSGKSYRADLRRRNDNMVNDTKIVDHYFKQIPEE